MTQSQPSVPAASASGHTRRTVLKGLATVPMAGLLGTTALGVGQALADGSGPYKHFTPGTRKITGKWTVYDIPTSYATPHCLAPDFRGNIWFVEIGANRIGVLNKKSGKFKEYMIPTAGATPHGITCDKNGMVYFSEAGADKIGRFDPKTETFREYPIPAGGKRKGARRGLGRIHTPMMGAGKYLWCTNEWLSTIVKLDPETGKTWEIQARFAGKRGSRPYGLQVDFAGDMWFAPVGSDYIGKIDAKTHKITEFPTPTKKSGPRRLTIDPKGRIWFSEWNKHKIGYIDPKTFKIKEYDLPAAPLSGAYALTSNGAGEIFVGEFISNQVSRFDPRTEKFTGEWQMPVRRARIRQIVTDEDGYIWYADNGNSNIVRLS